MSLPIPTSTLSVDDKLAPIALSETRTQDGELRNTDTYFPSGDNEKPKATSSASTTTQQDANSRFLEAPRLHRPNRPLSPDTLLSAEEYDQLRPSGSIDAFHHDYQDDDGAADAEKLRRTRASTWRIKVRGIWIRNLGLFYMLVAMLFGTLMNVTTRTLEIEGNKGKGLHPFQILFARMIITVVLAMIYMWYKKIPHFPLGDPQVRWLLVARGVGGFFGVFGMYYSLLYLPMADATVITFLAPSLSCWACSFLIKEPFTRIEKMGSLVAFVGVIFIARPTSLFTTSSSPSTAPPPPTAGSSTSDIVMAGGLANGTTAQMPDASNYDNVTPGERLAAVGIALVGVVGSVCAFTTIRWIGRRAHPLISVNYFAVWCTIVSTIAQLTLPGVGFLLPADAKDWGLLVFLGSCGFIMQFLMAAALSYEKSSRATNMTYTSMLYALAFDKWVFGQTPGVMSIIGSTLILGSAIYMALQRDGGGGANNLKENNEGGGGGMAGADEEEREIGGDDEEGVGLMGAMEDGEAGIDEESQDVEMRSLR